MPPSGTAMTTNSVPRTTRADYHKEALHRIRASLQPFAHGGPRERLSPVVCGPGDWGGSPVPPTPPRTTQHHLQPPAHLHHHVHHHLHHPHHHPSHHHNPAQPPPSSVSTNSSSGPYDVTTTTSTSSSVHHHLPHPASLPPRSTASASPSDFSQLPSATRHLAFEPPPPPPPPRVPPHHQTSTASSPSPQMPPLLSRMSPGPKGTKPVGPNYVNVSAAGPGRPVVVPHSAAPNVAVMGPPPPYPTQGKPIKVPPPPYPARQSPAVDRSSPASGVVSLGPTPPPLTAGGSLGAGAMAVALMPPQIQHQQQSSYGQTARQAKTPTPVIMQSVRSTQVQKPILQTAVAPPSPPPPAANPAVSTAPITQQQQQFTHYTGASLSSSSSASTITPSAAATPPPPPPYTPTPSNTSASPYTLPPTSSPYTLPPASPLTLPTSSPYTLPSSSSASPFVLPPSPYPLASPSSSPSPVTPPVQSLEASVPQFDPPSYHSTMQAKAAAARAYNNTSYSAQRGPYARGSTSPAPYGRGCASPALTSIPVQENPVQELDLSSTPLACIPIDTLSETGGAGGNLPDGYSECDGVVGTSVSVIGSRLSRVMADTPSTASPRSASPVSSVTSHDTHALSPSPVSCLSTATSSPSTQSDMTLESGYSSSSQSAVRGIMAPPPPPSSLSSIAQPLSTTSANINSNSIKSSLQMGAISATTTVTPSSSAAMPPPPPPPAASHHHKTMHQSPIPERKKKTSQDQDGSHSEPKIKYSPEAYKFYMEQHVENVIKSVEQRKHREMQLEKEMKKIGLSSKDQNEMRKVLCQKESNFIRLKRAKMKKSMFLHLKTIGVGAFGEVALVRKYDGSKLYAMKTLRKSDVIKRNQVAHVKAERDILAESDNDWVVKLYYSFQDSDNLYLIMDYIPGGDLMSLLIKFGIFKEPLARFYIAELVCAIESVHKMGFIHRDIKPDNILIDRDGHIKLTDFGLCTGFRWTHNSRYYQRKGEHSRQESMDPCGDNDLVCRCNDLKPLERRRRRQHLRCLAHSLVGTPNYIAPEVLDRKGYSQLCDWWSAGVILYEMLVGQPPFLANTPAETQYKVLNWESCLRIPKQANMSPEAKDLILRLLTSPEKRLGRNAQEIKNHGFFAGIDFDAGLRKQQALYIPEIKHPTDTSNFDPIEPDRLRSENDSDSDWFNTNQPYHGFLEFTFRRFFDSTPSTGGVVGPGTSSGGGSMGAGGAAGQASDDKDGQHPVYV